MYQKLIGSLMYLVNTWPDICFVINILTRFQVEPRHNHWIAAKQVLRYLRGTVDYGLRYVSNEDMSLQGYTNSDWASSTKDKKSTYGGCFSLDFIVISWMSRKQAFVALKTAKAVYWS